MKKFSTKTFKEMASIRNSSEYQDLMTKLLVLADFCERANLDSFVYRLLLNHFNLKSADLLGYSDDDDYRNFLGQLKGNYDVIKHWLDLNGSSDYANDITNILTDLACINADEEEDK